MFLKIENFQEYIDRLGHILSILDSFLLNCVRSSQLLITNSKGHWVSGLIPSYNFGLESSHPIGTVDRAVDFRFKGPRFDTTLGYPFVC